MTLHTPTECLAGAEGLTVVAEIVGDCPGCHYSIIPGHPIRLHNGRWHHQKCVRAGDTTSNAQHTTEA